MILDRQAPIGSAPLSAGEVRVPEPGPGEVRVRVRACVCQSASACMSSCGVCVSCRSGRENLGESSLFPGSHADGGYAEFAVVPEAYAYAIPEVFEDAEATPLLCAGIIGYRALRRSDNQTGRGMNGHD